MKRAKLQYAIKSSTCLNDGVQNVSTAISYRCKTGLPNSCSIQPRPKLLHAACHNYHEAAFTHFNNFANIRPKKSVGKEFKMKSEIDLQHSCYQSVMVWWSTRSSACRRVGEWRPIVNMSVDNNREPG